MFLTRIEIDPRRRLARRYLGSSQVMHAVVMKAATGGDAAPVEDPEVVGPGAGRVLWRVDVGDFGVLLYILSPQAPAIQRLEHEVAAPGTQARTVDYGPFLSRLADGQVWAFRLAANPQRAVPQGLGVRGKRCGHVTVNQQRQWLTERAARNGFSLLDQDPSSGHSAGVTAPYAPEADNWASVLVVRRQRPVFSRQRDGGRGRDRVRINRTVYEGALRITDVALIRQVLVGGLGASKAYGCGLLTLARPGG
ncbi:type I-E CRISPR-associated protein Cas6/Cse3/CasE [Actinomyces wuliandei]|uniref:type I-E CRISPR-associated protein Cas6/Cse3/CasE n=1 Tax=Actinomyces wuliandei TaxID=2057743 RepID=UPI000FD761F3|nr:type I-E CRISPR-associated protein Cas6/Cse3/CasE [Actinomyces wuliandei]